jgi:ribosome modulation factor
MTTRRRRHTLAIAAAALKGFHTGLAGGSLSDNYFIATNQRTAWIFGFEDGVKQRALSDGWLLSGTIFVGDKVTGPNGYEARIVGIGSPEQNEDQTRSPIDPHSAGNTGE